jgi:hypothetical protein
MREPLSPELALVSPELAEAARLLLPDRPWEAFAPPRPLRVLAVPEPEPVDEPQAPPAALPSRRPRRRLTTGRVATLAFAALLAASCVLPPRDAPRLVAAPEPAAAQPQLGLRTTGAAPCVPAADGQRAPVGPACPSAPRR